MTPTIITMEVGFEHDVVLVRQRAKQVAELLGFDTQDQTRIATAVSEIARNTFNYAGGGKVELLVDQTPQPPQFLIRVTDTGPGIEDLPLILEGRYKSKTGMGSGITGAKRMMDRFEIETEAGQGTTVLLGKPLPASTRATTGQALARIADRLLKLDPTSPLEQMRQQNQELSRLLEELQRRQAALARINRELEETNQRTIVLHSELEQKNAMLEKASQLKSQFLANMSHELRTPLNSIIGFTSIILQGMSGDLNEEQKTQLGMVYDSAKHLLSLINDILDLSKIEAGKIEILPTEFDLRELIDNVQTMVAPMVREKGLALETEIGERVPAVLCADRSRLKQVLVNLLSNAAKFTDQGQIVLACRISEDPQSIWFGVRDTGRGIKSQSLESIFEEFTQAQEPDEQKPEGTGLGQPISRRIVELMGGTMWAESEPGKGSHFQFTVPVAPAAKPAGRPMVEPQDLDPSKKLILTIDDEPAAQEIMRTHLQHEGYQVIQAYNGLEAMELARKFHPFAITLDIIMPGKDGWDILRELKDDPQTEDIPIVCVSILDNRELGLSLGAVEYLVKPIDPQLLVKELKRLKSHFAIHDILVIDDDPGDAELLATHLRDANDFSVRTAGSGREGLAMAQQQLPDLILLDLMMPEMDGFEVVRRLKQSDHTKDIPIIIVSAKNLSSDEKRLLNSQIEGIIRKGDFRKEQLLDDVDRWLGRLSQQHST